MSQPPPHWHPTLPPYPYLPDGQRRGAGRPRHPAPEASASGLTVAAMVLGVLGTIALAVIVGGTAG